MTQIHRFVTSPNTVLANALEDALDLLIPRLEINKPSEVVFNVGTQINGVPHIGTYIVQAMSFVVAQKVSDRFGIKTKVRFGALDNAPYELKDGANGQKYQIAYGHALEAEELNSLVDCYYIHWMDELSRNTGIKYSVSWYKDFQATSLFRKAFLQTLTHREQLRYCVAPSKGVLRIRIPEPATQYAEKYALNTRLIDASCEKATFSCVGIEGECYQANFSLVPNGFYLDLNTLYRNVVKELACSTDGGCLYVMMKGGDWCFSTQPVDWALGILGVPQHKAPMRLFTPQVVTETGAKLSKSLIRDGDSSMNCVPEWVIDMGKFSEHFGDTYVDKMLVLCNLFLSHPRHMYRAYTWMEIQKILEKI